MTDSSRTCRFAICVNKADYDDLEKGKVYPVLPDEDAARSAFIRVVDASGEDYLYPDRCFVFIELPEAAQEAILAQL